MKRRYKTMHAEQADDREPIDLFGGTDRCHASALICVSILVCFQRHELGGPMTAAPRESWFVGLGWVKFRPEYRIGRLIQAGVVTIAGRSDIASNAWFVEKMARYYKPRS